MVRRVGLGVLLFTVLGVATLATIAGLGGYSLPDGAASAAPATHARVFNALASERLLVRTLPAVRTEAPAPVAHLEAPVATPSKGRRDAAVTSSRLRAAFVATRAAKKHPTSSTVVARR